MDGAFEFKGERHSDAEVQNIHVHEIHTAGKIERHAVGMDIILKSREKLQIIETDVDSLLNSVFGDNLEAICGLRTVRDLLMSRTLSQRTSYYLKELGEKGFFTYDECRFYPGDKIVFKDKEFRLEDSSFLKARCYIEMRPRKFTTLDKLRREFSFGRIPQFNTQADPDVIFTLLDKFFGLRW